MGVQLDLTDIQTGFLSAAAQTANNTLIEQALDSALDRTGAVNNAMEIDLDMGLNSIINVVTDVTNPKSVLSVEDGDARYINVDGDTLTGDINAGGFQITNLGSPTTPESAARVIDVGPDSAALLRVELGEGVRLADNLSDLESKTGRFDGDSARLMGRTALGDGGEGNFRWDSSDLSSTLVVASATSDSVDDTTDTINDADHPFSDGDGVITQTTVNGLTAQTVYWVVNSTSGTYQLSATFGGGAIDLTGTTNVTIDKLLDPLKGVYVTSTTDLTGTGGAWVRAEISQVRGEWFGCKEDSGVTGNNFLLRKAFELAQIDGHKAVTLTRVSESGHFGLEKINGTSAIRLYDNVDFLGLGRPKLRPNVGADTYTTFMEASIFLPGNYHPDFWQSVSKESVTLTSNLSTVSVADSSIYNVGQLIMVTSQTNFLTGGSFPVYEYMEVFEIEDITGPTTIVLTGGSQFSGPGFISSVDHSDVNGRFSEPLFMLKNVTVDNFEIDTANFWIGDSATYKCEFRNIFGRARSGIYGNTYCKTKFNDIRLTCYNIFSEIGFGSHDNRMSEIELTAINDGTFGSTGLSWQESGRNNELSGFIFDFGENTNVSNPARIQDHQNSWLRRGVIRIRSNSNNALAIVDDGTADKSHVQNSGFDDIEIYSGAGIPVICDAESTASTSDLKSGFFKNIRYYGTKPSTAGLRIRGNSTTPLKTIGADVYSDGANVGIIATDATDNNILLRGDWSLSVIRSLANRQRIKLLDPNRSGFLSMPYRSNADTSVTSTTPGNVVITRSGFGLDITDRIRVKVAGTTTGVAGNKNIEIGYSDSGGTFRSISLVTANAESFSIDVDVAFRSGTIALATGVVWGSASGISGQRISHNLASDISATFSLQVRAWSDTAPDSITINQLDFSILGLVDG